MRILMVFIVVIIFYACSSERKDFVLKSVDWESRSIQLDTNYQFHTGSSYLSVYSEIYDMTDETTHLLTATVSIRNISLTDSLFITKADYYNTKGERIRSYLKRPIYLTPMETVEIIIPRKDASGGSGANFIFDWALRRKIHEPLFEAVMIWTTGNQGISFVTRGEKL